MSDYEYAIGLSVEGLQNLEDDLNIPPPYPAPFQEWASDYAAGDGRVYGDGWPSATWHFDYLSTAHVAALRTYCTGKSANVYIRTLQADHTSYGTYLAVMIWPSRLDYRVGRASTDVELVFTHLQEVS